MSRLYLDTGLFSYNGNGASGNEMIQKFVIELPPSEHMVVTLDAQPISGKLISIYYLTIFKTENIFRHCS